VCTWFGGSHRVRRRLATGCVSSGRKPFYRDVPRNCLRSRTRQAHFLSGTARRIVLLKLYQFADLLRRHGRQRHMTEDHALGRRGEDVAHRFLQRNGFVIVDRNYRMASGGGEVDLVAWEADTLVFVEVKSRKTAEYGSPDRAIGLEKQSSLLRAAREYARHAEVPWEQIRFDVVNVVFTAPPVVTHFRDVFGQVPSRHA
jgi:putative endonuclease